MGNARDLEMVLLARCVDAAGSALLTAADSREANVFRLAAMVIESRYPAQSLRLMRASESYFMAHPAEKFTVAEVLRRGWVSSLPRVRDMLSEHLNRQGSLN